MSGADAVGDSSVNSSDDAESSQGDRVNVDRPAEADGLPELDGARLLPAVRPPDTSGIRALVDAVRPPDTSGIRALVDAVRPPDTSGIRALVDAVRPPDTSGIRILGDAVKSIDFNANRILGDAVKSIDFGVNSILANAVKPIEVNIGGFLQEAAKSIQFDEIRAEIAQIADRREISIAQLFGDGRLVGAGASELIEEIEASAIGAAGDFRAGRKISTELAVKIIAAALLLQLAVVTYIGAPAQFKAAMEVLSIPLGILGTVGYFQKHSK